MNSHTSDLSTVGKPELYNTAINTRNAFSAVKRTRPCLRRKFLSIKPLRLDEIQKEIELAEANTCTWTLPEETSKQADQENKDVSDSQTRKSPNKPQNNNLRSKTPKLQDSFDLDFAALSLNTPIKQPEVAKKSNFVTPGPGYKPVVAPKTGVELQYVTPNNKIPSKVQCSVNMQPYLKTPITKLYAAPHQSEPDCDPKTVQSCENQKVGFNKIKVNNVLYIVLNELGKGGSSEVFHCFDPATKSHRALKVVSLENRASATGFINEVKVLQSVQTCNRIIKMFDYEIKEDKKVLLVVLEVGGTDLSKILKESALNTTHMPLYMLLYYWMEMLYAVKQIHSKGIIHSDLKPANFLKVEGYLKLIDFGIASCIQMDMTSVVKAVPEGSFNYISPEALSNENGSVAGGKPKYKISYKSDVWSLGCILYQLVYRRTPFQHVTNTWSKLATIVDPNHKIEYPEASWVPKKIIETIKGCLQANMRLRPSVDELIAEYESMFHSLA